MTGTRISDMATRTRVATGDFVPVISGGINYKVDLASLLPVTLEAFGGAADGVTDNLAAFNAMFVAMPTGGFKLQLGHGTYFFSDTPKVQRYIEIEGQGKQATTILVPGGKDGIHFYHTGDAPTPGLDGSYTVLRSVIIRAAAKTTTAHGIFITGSAVKIEDVVVSSFKGDGVHIVAAAPGNNANLWGLNAVRSQQNDGHGFFFDGPDSNAGVATRCDASSNLGWGFYDSSFLGNTFVGCHTATNTLGAYKTDDPSARTILLGCYSESDQPTSSFSTRTMVIGGLHAAGLSGGLVLADGANPGYIAASAFESEQTYGGGALYTALGGAAGSGELFRLGHSTLLGDYFRMKFNGTDIVADYQNITNNQSFGITLPTTAQQFGSGVAKPNVFFVPVIAIGDRIHGADTAAPTTGTAARGTIVYNTAPSAGGKLGWVCTASGSPGTWKPFGAIDP